MNTHTQNPAPRATSLRLLAALLMTVLAVPAFGASLTAEKNGFWDDTSIWKTSIVAGDNDNANIGHASNNIIVSTRNTTVTVGYLRIGSVATTSATSVLNLGGDNDTSSITLNGSIDNSSVGRSNNSTSTFNIYENGTFDGSAITSNTNPIRLGHSNSSYGILNIVGGDFTANRLYTGNDATSGGGEINVIAGNLIVTSHVYMGSGIGNDLRNGNKKTSGPAIINIRGGTVRFGGALHMGGINLLTTTIDKPKYIDIAGGNMTGGTLYLASKEHTTANSTISGGNTIFTSAMRIGCDGNATMEMTGGSITTGQVRIGIRESANVTATTNVFTMSGGNFTSNGVLGIGNRSNTTNTFTVNGGEFTVGTTTTVGNGSNSTITVGGGNFTTPTMVLNEASFANSTVVVSAGNLVATDSLVVSDAANSTSTITVSGGELKTGTLLFANKTNTTNTFTIENGKVSVGTLILGDRANTTLTATISGGELTANTVTAGTNNENTFALNLSGGNLIVNDSFSIGSPRASTLNLTITGGLLKTGAGADLVVGIIPTTGRGKARLDMSGGRMDIGGSLYVGNGISTVVSSATQANFFGNSNVNITGALSLAAEGSTNPVDISIGEQAAITTAGLSMKQRSRVLFKVAAPSHTATLNVTGSGNFSAVDSSRIVIDLSNFNSATGGHFNTNLMGYAGAAQSASEANTQLYLGSLNRGISNATYAWANGAGGRVLNLSFDYTATPAIGDVPTRIRHNATRAIRAVTANIRGETDPGNSADSPSGNDWTSRKALFVEVLAAQTADIIGFQEVRSAQEEYIKTGLPGYTFACTIKPDGHPTTMIGYSTARFEKLDEGGFWLPPIGEDGTSSRMVNWVKLTDKTTGLPLYAINTHLDHDQDATRVLQMQALLDFIDTLPSDIPYLLTGDFNCGVDSNPINLTSAAGMIDSYATIHGPMEPGMTAHDFYGDALEGANVRKKIDYVFHNNLFTPIEAEVVKDNRNGKFPSDHYFVSAELYFVQEPIVVPSSPVGSWREDNFGTTENSGAAANSADPDFDGVPNLLEYAYGADPLAQSANSGKLPTGEAEKVDGQYYLTYTFKKNPEATDIVYTPQVSSDLQNWFSDAGNVITVSSSDTEVTVADATPLSGTPRYIRLAVALDEDGDLSTAAAAPVGGMLHTVAAGETGFFGLPFARPAAWRGVAETVLASTVSGADADWTAGEFTATPHYLEILEGDDAGLMLDITANTADSLTVSGDLSTLDLVGNVFVIRPHATLASTFGAANEAGLKSGLTMANSDELLLFNTTTQAAGSYYYKSGGPGGAGWRGWSSTLANEANKLLPPHQAIGIIRKGSSAISIATVGEARVGRQLALVVPAYNWMTATNPYRQTLAESGLWTGNAATGLQGGLTMAAADEIMLWNGTAWDSFYYKTGGPGGSGWRSWESTLTSRADELLKPGSIYIIRRKAVSSFLHERPAATVTTP